MGRTRTRRPSGIGDRCARARRRARRHARCRGLDVDRRRAAPRRRASRHRPTARSEGPSPPSWQPSPAARPHAVGPARTGGVRGRIGRYAAHDEVGADLLSAGRCPPGGGGVGAGAPPPRPVGRDRDPAPVCRALAQADGEPVSGQLWVNRTATVPIERMCRTRPRARTSSISTRRRLRRGRTPIGREQRYAEDGGGPGTRPQAAQAQDPRPPGVAAS